jgi:hypothetical protein
MEFRGEKDVDKWKQAQKKSDALLPSLLEKIKW